MLEVIVRVSVGLNIIVIDNDWRYNLCGIHLQSQIELYPVS